ncbi:MAG: hypothetical protein KHX46_06605 [Clostridiales bacterium]|nr:hypothetical protein [Clostridiales bacterium]
MSLTVDYGFSTITATRLRRRLSLEGLWRCRTDPENIGAAEGWNASPIQEEFRLPVPGYIQQLETLAANYPSAEMSNGYLGSFWLETSLDIGEKTQEQYRLILGGVAPFAHIWVNGQYAAAVRYGLTAAGVDITALVQSGVNRLTLQITEQHTGQMAGMRFRGLNWSGLFRSAFLEIGAAAYIRDFGPLVRSGVPAVEGCTVGGAGGKVLVQLRGDDGGEVRVQTAVEADGRFRAVFPEETLTLWSPDAPVLYQAEAVFYDAHGNALDDLEKKIGFRELTASGRRFLLNGQPLYLTGAGQEYHSPMAAPLIDRELILRRWQALREAGFNFFRFHTSMPTEEELAAADEAGILLCSEVGLISNFNKITPFEEGLELLARHILQTRGYASMMVYGLGNEGSQLLLYDEKERVHAAEGYRVIRENAAGQLGIVAFGMQGEVPSLSNDFETPHLWDYDFTKSYDYLTNIAWEALPSSDSKPSLIHEFGKFGVWPDPEEEALYPLNGCRREFASQGRETLERLGLAHLEGRLIERSRYMAQVFWRVIMEEARRQPDNSGVCMWNFFRCTLNNSGLIDDFARSFDMDPAALRRGPASPVAVLIDFGFGGRNLLAGSTVGFAVTVSNFGGAPVRDAVLEWRFGELTGKLGGIAVHNGGCDEVGRIVFTVPVLPNPRKQLLQLILKSEGTVLSENSFAFWVFPMREERLRGEVCLHMQDRQAAEHLKHLLPGAYPLLAVDSMVRGCRSWKGPDFPQTTAQYRPSLVIADRMDDVVRLCMERRIPVLLLDDGKLPEEWYCPLLEPGMGLDDPSCAYTSFRAGWDRGALATLVEEDGLLGDFPHEGTGDLQFYPLLEGARGVDRRALGKAFHGWRSHTVMRRMTKIRVDEKSDVVLQDVQALRARRIFTKRTFDAREELLLEHMENDGGHLVICMLRLLHSPAGCYLLKNLIASMKTEHAERMQERNDYSHGYPHGNADL